MRCLILTSTSAAGLAETGVSASPPDQVVRLGKLAVDCGLRGLVCSPLEIAPLRAVLPTDVALVTPGIRPRDAKADDQTRVMTPGEAARAGASYLVVGRPIFKAPDPVAADDEVGEGDLLVVRALDGHAPTERHSRPVVATPEQECRLTRGGAAAPGPRRPRPVGRRAPRSSPTW